ncbi:PREDICTED: monocarboxylate transporter 12-like [Priapulus caudatus]|uniref:Monocarboxylate transporter 12-like n=1 Tax=Priapulus caudatus TaxID=37621 RepID=A0ABM1DQ72_PRICU|nr:PREDICTED: monocarboxylate transporter 12-like [Priapulus caudatus]
MPVPNKDALSFGVARGMINTPSKVINGVYFDKKRSLATGLAITSGAVGALIGPLLCVKLIELYTWHGTLIILAGMYLQTVAASALFRDIPKAAKEELSQRRSSNNTSLMMPIPDMIKFGAHCLSSLAMGFSTLMFVTFCVLYGMSQGLSLARAAQMMSVINVSSALSAFLVAATGDRPWFPRPLVYGLATLTISIIAFLFLLAGELSVFVVCCVFYGCSGGIRASMETAMLVDLFGIEHLPTVQPIYSLFFGLGAFTGPLAAGGVLDYTGNLKLVVILCGSTAGLSAALLSGALYIDYRQKHTKQEEPPPRRSSKVEIIFDDATRSQHI